MDKLVQEGFLERQSIANDRRKTKLICTEKAQPIIDKGHKLQENFIEKLFENIALEEENTSDKGKEEPAESSDSEGEN